MIADMARVDGGVEALMGLVRLFASASLTKKDVLLWGASVAEPLDQGPSEASDNVRGRKIRPIALEEALVKLALSLRTTKETGARWRLASSSTTCGSPSGACAWAPFGAVPTGSRLAGRPPSGVVYLPMQSPT